MTEEQKEVLKRIFIENASCENCEEIGCNKQCYEEGKKHKCSCDEFLNKWFKENGI